MKKVCVPSSTRPSSYPSDVSTVSVRRSFDPSVRKLHFCAVTPNWLRRSGLGDMRRQGRTGHPQAEDRQLISRLRSLDAFRENADRSRPGGLHPRHIDPHGRRSGQSDGHERHSNEPGEPALRGVRRRSASTQQDTNFVGATRFFHLFLKSLGSGRLPLKRLKIRRGGVWDTILAAELPSLHSTHRFQGPSSNRPTLSP